MKIAYLLAAGLSIFLFVCHAAAADNKPVVFTNEDLAKHSATDNRDSVDNKPSKKSDAKKLSVRHKASDNKGKERWCKKARLYKNRIDETKASLYDAEKRYAEARDRSAANSSTKKRHRQKKEVSDAGVRKARLKLKKAETALNDLEQEAHRNNIPPGWLRCQFSD